MEQLREASQAPNNDGKLYVSETVCSRFVSYVHLLIHLIVSNSADIDDHLLSPCNQEEADTRIILHVADMARTGKKKIRMRTVDTDVVILCIAFFYDIPGLEELRVAFGRGKQYRHIPIHQIANSLGKDKSKALLGFHAFTGCDSVSAFYDIGKKGPWQVWKDFPEVTKAFCFISTAPANIPEDMMSLLEEFVVRVYSSKLEGVTTVNRARYEMFTYGGKDFDHLPPTKNALSFHTLRAAYIAGHVWGQALDPSPNLPSPSSWGYEMKNNTWIPKWTTLPTISKQHLIICKCKKKCKPPCLCASNAVCRTSLCTCRGECYGRPRN